MTKGILKFFQLENKYLTFKTKTFLTELNSFKANFNTTFANQFNMQRNVIKAYKGN